MKSLRAESRRESYTINPVVSFREAAKLGLSSEEKKILLGGKGGNLVDMCQLGMPVPPGFTVITEVCTDYQELGMVPEEVTESVHLHMADLGTELGRTFGDVDNPLLVSVRSGARYSMPGMMDTVLNVGLNDKSVKSLAEKSGSPLFAYDSYRRLIQMFGDVVLGIDGKKFEAIIEARKSAKQVVDDLELTAEDWESITIEFKALIEKEGKIFPQDAWEQLDMATEAVFSSWNSNKAKSYRELEGIPDEWGTAVNIQAMVFGNMNENSGTGVFFTRDRNTGEDTFLGDYLRQAQGEDVVAGIRKTKNITELENDFPEISKELKRLVDVLERYYADMQDIEFTIEDGKLFMLQTRNGKRTGPAALKIAVDMEFEQLVTREQALMQIAPELVRKVLLPSLKEEETKEVLTIGIGASPGAGAGIIAIKKETADKLAAEGVKYVLVRSETSPNDLDQMENSQGVLTARGGNSSHAAVVMSGRGKPCVCGASEMNVNEETGEVTINGKILKEGNEVTIDGTSGEVILGLKEIVRTEPPEQLETILTWADEVRTLGVWANADNAEEAAQALSFGAEGIGLCRTEHMCLEGKRRFHLQRMILSQDEVTRKDALEKLSEFQRADFESLFRVMKDKPVTVRLLDNPLHEILPEPEDDLGPLAESLACSKEEIRQLAAGRSETNPMLGFRGARLMHVHHEVIHMQVKSIVRAAVDAREVNPKIDIMIPLIASEKEFVLVKQKIEAAMIELTTELGPLPEFRIGAMLETPGGAFRAGEMTSRGSQFFSFGTNDLTQLMLGISREDGGPFLQSMKAQGIFVANPFKQIDEPVVGEAVKLGVDLSRGVDPNIKLGVCGEHGGDPKSIDFFHRAGLNYVSGSPLTLQTARLAAAQAAIRNSCNEALEKA